MERENQSFISERGFGVPQFQGNTSKYSQQSYHEQLFAPFKPFQFEQDQIKESQFSQQKGMFLKQSRTMQNYSPQLPITQTPVKSPTQDPQIQYLSNYQGSPKLSQQSQLYVNFTHSVYPQSQFQTPQKQFNNIKDFETNGVNNKSPIIRKLMSESRYVKNNSQSKGVPEKSVRDQDYQACQIF